MRRESEIRDMIKRLDEEYDRNGQDADEIDAMRDALEWALGEAEDRITQYFEDEEDEEDEEDDEEDDDPGLVGIDPGGTTGIAVSSTAPPLPHGMAF